MFAQQQQQQQDWESQQHQQSVINQSIILSPANYMTHAPGILSPPCSSSGSNNSVIQRLAENNAKWRDTYKESGNASISTTPVTTYRRSRDSSGSSWQHRPKIHINPAALQRYSIATPIYHTLKQNPHFRFQNDCDETAAAENETTATMTTTRSTAATPTLLPSFDHSVKEKLYRGPDIYPEPMSIRLYDTQGPISFPEPPVDGGQHIRAELRTWPIQSELIISQNSSKRKVHRGLWFSPLYPDISFPVAIKFVEDGNPRDGRSIRREIDCHIFIYTRLLEIQKTEGYQKLEDAWPSSELLGYHMDKKNPGKCLLITRKLSGPDFFDVIRQEHAREGRIKLSEEYNKLNWCSIALKRLQQYAMLGIRHNDIKPDNIVIDWYTSPDDQELIDVKIIDLGTASMQGAKEFTGGTSWYESPEQKLLEFYSKKQRNPEAAKKVDIGLASDVWAAGLSITEVLVGKRVVDALKHPHGPGPLEFRGPLEGWTVDPVEWIQIARNALLSSPRKNNTYTYCYDAAQWIFDHLVKAIAIERSSLQDAIDKLGEQSDLAYLRSRRNPTTRSIA